MKLPKVFIALLIVACISAAPALAQEDEEFNYERAYKDYIYNFNLYQNAHSTYQLARNQYLQAKTLTSQNNALEATRTMLQARDQTMITYLTAIRLKLAETPGLSDIIRDGLYSRIDQEVAWLNTHKENLTSAATLEDIVEDSNEARDRLGIQKTIAFDAMRDISSSTVQIHRQSTSDIIAQIRVKVSEIRGRQNKDTGVIERWILETDNRVTRSLEKDLEAASEYVNLYDRRNIPTYLDYVKSVQFRFEESIQYLKEANSYLKEIVKEIKTAD